ncbi:MAG TPA: tetratricopeptide repeat protein, partial [Thermoanaerobaculia bacterium]|nr:tetratricopeptide repeat protein [Thermoanaerobaculia bacterium]
SLTGGIDGPVLFTTFERYLPLPRVLDRIGQVFGAALEGTGVHWLALDDSARRQVALQVLTQVPVLWIWDNVEPVAGFPAETESAWTAKEQEELLGFLRDLRGTKAKVLLTSRRDERPWLGELPMRITVPPMPMTESLQLVRALADRNGRRITEVKDWRPLLTFARGNPMTLTVVAGEALRQGLKTKGEIEAFVARLRSGEAAFSDEVSEGRSRSLGASLAYGFEAAFSEEERKRLALLHLFQGFVDVDVLCWMGDPKMTWCLPEVRGLTRDESIALLDRAAEVGLLTAYGGGYYGIHPALPWFFKELFERCYPAEGLAAVRAFVEAMGELGDYYMEQYEHGKRDVLGALRAEEANLLQARRLARTHGWWDPVASAMQGLRQLYAQTGRRAEWKRLVEEIVPDFVDPMNNRPLPGREDCWSLITQYRVSLAREERQWAEAERLQTACVAWDHQRAAPALARPIEELKSGERNTIRTLAAALHTLGQIRRELGQVNCVLAYERFKEARAAKRPEEELLRYLNEAVGYYHEALELFPADAVNDLAVTHNALGVIYRSAGDLDRAVQHYREAVRRLEQGGDIFHAAQTRFNVAVALLNAGRRENALEYAEAALRGFEPYGEGAMKEIAETRRLIAAIRG